MRSVHIGACVVVACLTAVCIALAVYYAVKRTLSFAAVRPVSRRSFAAVRPVSRRAGYYVSAALKGGLGNQLFQMATAHGVADSLHSTAVIYAPSIEASVTIHSAERYTDTIFAAWDVITREVGVTASLYTQAPEDTFVYKQIPDGSAQHLQLSGYFQNEAYFKHCFADFASKLVFPDNLQLLPRTCFIHLRFGDYLVNTVHHVELTKKYLERAMHLQRARNPGLQFLLFSDDTAKCKGLAPLNAPDVAFNEEANEVRALVQMSKCWIGGICSNSTFAWWGAYLNANSARVVTFPRKWINNDWPVDIQFAGSIVLPHD